MALSQTAAGEVNGCLAASTLAAQSRHNRSAEARRRALQTVRHLHWLVMIAIPTEKPKPPKVNLREELIEQLMEAKGMSREAAELAIDSSY